ncbi:hypothetical protein OXX80_000238 [Metschnikowia pulcherrima]
MNGFTSIATSVTPTTTITATNNGTTATFLYPSMATTSGGCYVTKNAGASQKSGVSAGVWAFFILLVTSTTAAMA